MHPPPSSTTPPGSRHAAGLSPVSSLPMKPRCIQQRLAAARASAASQRCRQLAPVGRPQQQQQHQQQQQKEAQHSCKQRQRQQQQQQQHQPLPSALAPGAVLALLQLVTDAPAASAATVCFDVPEWLADWRGSLLHSPGLAIGAAATGLLLFPKLIRLAINYLALPVFLAMLAYGAVSFPQQTASGIGSVLEFVREHPAASSAGVIVGAGMLLGPDLLAGAAVSGVLVLLAAQLGFLQLPSLPSLPRLPGQELVARQLGRTGAALRERLDALDGDGDGDDKGASATRAGVPTRQRAPAPAPAPTPAASAVQAGSSGQAARQPQPRVPVAQQQQQQQQQPQPQQQQPLQQQQRAWAGGRSMGGLEAPAGGDDASGTGGLGAAFRQLGSGVKALGGEVVSRGRQLQQTGAVQDAGSRAAAAVQRAAAELARQGAHAVDQLQQQRAAAPGAPAAAAASVVAAQRYDVDSMLGSS